MSIDVLAATLVLLFGLVGLAAPEAVARQTGLVAAGPPGRSELRALFGGLFVGLALAALLTAAAAAYWAAAAAFFGGAAAKLLAAALERGVFPAALPGLAFDVAVGGLLVAAARALAAG